MDGRMFLLLVHLLAGALARPDGSITGSTTDCPPISPLSNNRSSSDPHIPSGIPFTMWQVFSVPGILTQNYSVIWYREPYPLSVSEGHYETHHFNFTEYNRTMINATLFLFNASVEPDYGHYFVHVELYNSCVSNSSEFRLSISNCSDQEPPEPDIKEKTSVLAEPIVPMTWCVDVTYHGVHSTLYYLIKWMLNDNVLCDDDDKPRNGRYTCTMIDYGQCTSTSRFCIQNYTHADSHMYTTRAYPVASGGPQGNKATVNLDVLLWPNITDGPSTYQPELFQSQSLKYEVANYNPNHVNFTAVRNEVEDKHLTNHISVAPETPDKTKAIATLSHFSKSKSAHYKLCANFSEDVNTSGTGFQPQCSGPTKVSPEKWKRQLGETIGGVIAFIIAIVVVGVVTLWCVRKAKKRVRKKMEEEQQLVDHATTSRHSSIQDSLECDGVDEEQPLLSPTTTSRSSYTEPGEQSPCPKADGQPDATFTRDSLERDGVAQVTEEQPLLSPATASCSSHTEPGEKPPRPIMTQADGQPDATVNRDSLERDGVAQVTEERPLLSPATASRSSLDRDSPQLQSDGAAQVTSPDFTPEQTPTCRPAPNPTRYYYPKFQRYLAKVTLIYTHNPSKDGYTQIVPDRPGVREVREMLDHDAALNIRIRQHKLLVHKFATFLQRSGVAVAYDQLLYDSGVSNRKLWFEKQINDSDFIILIITPSFHKFLKESGLPDDEYMFEGDFLYNIIDQPRGRRFLPVFLNEVKNTDLLPPALEHTPSYKIRHPFDVQSQSRQDDLVKLYRLLTRQASQDVAQQPPHIVHLPEDGVNPGGGVVDDRPVSDADILMLSQNPSFSEHWRLIATNLGVTNTKDCESRGKGDQDEICHQVLSAWRNNAEPGQAMLNHLAEAARAVDEHLFEVVHECTCTRN